MHNMGLNSLSLFVVSPGPSCSPLVGDIPSLDYRKTMTFIHKVQKIFLFQSVLLEMLTINMKDRRKQDIFTSQIEIFRSLSY